MWRSGEDIANVLRLLESGLDAGSVARLTGVVGTVRTWRRGDVPERARRALAGIATCDGCGGPAHRPDDLPAAAYAYLLGMYLGDGCLYRAGRGFDVLRIALDAAYPGIVASARAAIVAVHGGRLPHAARDKRSLPHSVPRREAVATLDRFIGPKA